MCQGVWLFCHGGARLILQMTRCILMRASMPAMFLLALRALFDAATSPPASPPFVLPCGGASALGSPFHGIIVAKIEVGPWAPGHFYLTVYSTVCASGTTHCLQPF